MCALYSLVDFEGISGKVNQAFFPLDVASFLISRLSVDSPAVHA